MTYKLRHDCPPTEVRIGFSSDVGRARDIDEDSIAVIEVTNSYRSERRRRVLLIIADGMGGHSHGDVASRIGAQAIVNKVIGLLMSDGDIPPARYHMEISNAISHANEEILEFGARNPSSEKMGTTVAMAIIDGNLIHVAHVGDSRVYLINGERIGQITKDHSYVQELVEQDKITSEQARNHPRKNVITKVVGYYGEVKADTCSLVLDVDDRILVCCDGLTSHVEDREIWQIVLRNTVPQRACDELVSLANERGGTDNISVIVACLKNDS